MDTFGKEQFQPFAALCFLLSGLPLLYAGQENGAVNLPDLFEKDAIDWQDRNEPVADFYKRLLFLYNQFSCMRKGQIEFIEVSNKEVIGIKIYDKHKTLYALLNFTDESVNFTCPLLTEAYGTDLLYGQVFDGEEINFDPWQVQIIDLVEDDLLMI